MPKGAAQSSTRASYGMFDLSPSRVFDDISIDIFCHAGNHYLIYADRLYDWNVVFEFMKRDLCSHDDMFVHALLC
jgi:hypothetical protein